jgi:integrase
MVSSFGENGKATVKPRLIGKVGWHTFRHTFSSILHQAGTSLAVQKELLRHADIQTTMNIYTQAVSVDKREAVELVTKRLLNG